MQGNVPKGSARKRDRLSAARDYIKRGWRPVPIPPESKSPKIASWQTLSVDEANVDQYFGDEGNIGIILGVDGLTDIDLDCAEAVTAGRYLLPATGMVFGRASKPSSHYCYMVTPAAPMEKLLDPTDKKATICEFRCLKKDGGIGLQTVFPPSIHPSGESVEFTQNGEPTAISERELRQAFYRTAAAAVLAQNWPAAGEGRHDAMLALAGVLARAGWSEGDATTFCRAVYRSVPTHDRTALSRVDTEVADTFRKLAKDQHFTGFPTLRARIKNSNLVIPAVSRWLKLDERSQRVESISGMDAENNHLELEELVDGDGSEPEGDEDVTELSELGLSRLLAHRDGKDLRYVHQERQWYCWRGTHWQRDDTQEVVRRVIAIVRKMTVETCRSHSKIAGALKLAGADDRVASSMDEFDAQHHLLNFKNGTLDLRTGKLGHHWRDDRITKLIPYDYDPRARAPRWERFLCEVFEPHPGLRLWVQRAIGYSLTADVSEHCFFLMLGNGRNGKGVFINTLKLIFGAYAHQADFRAFEPKYGDGPLDAVANFRGARLIVASESKEGARFDEALMKTLTGGDPIRARLLHANSFEMQPTWHIWLASNYRPQIKGTDPAIWQRVRLIPFDVSFVGREDRSLPEALQAEAAGIIAWAVEGAMRWREEGLDPLPDAVKIATDSYRTESDVIGRFLEEEIELGVQFSASARDLYRRYVGWGDSVGESTCTATAFGLQLSQRGFQKTRTASGFVYHGLRITNRVESVQG
jgi:putative DNA primase/helicase